MIFQMMEPKKFYVKLKIYDLLLFHNKNLGKGSYRTAQKYVVGKYTIIQDADLEMIQEIFKNFKLF